MYPNQAVADFLAQSSTYRLTGLMPQGTGSTGSLPSSSHSVDDKGSNPFHPDSPMFWVAVFGTLVIVGVAGMSGSGRVGPVKAGFKAGRK